MARRIGLEQIGAEAVILGTPEFFRLAKLVEGHLDDINKTTKKLEGDSNKSWASMATAVGVASAAIAASTAVIVGAVGGLAGIAVGVASEFQQKFAIVEAITGGTANELAALEDVIRGIGTTSIISMGQAAEAAGELARGGISIQDQIGGAVKAVTDLTIASAGELEIGRSATLVAAALNAFSLSGEDAVTVVNAITAAAQKSSITFVDLQRSFQQVAPVASAFGFTVEETAAALGVLGLAGIRGSDAGTSLKQAFIQLAKPTKVGAELMNEFGINLLDTEGRARPLRDVIIDLEKSFGPAAVEQGKLTEAQRRFAVAAIFGSDAIRAALVSATQGVSAFDAMTDAMHDSAFSAETLANIMQQPLSAQFIILQNNISSLAQRIGAGLLPVLRNLTVEAIRVAQSLDPLAKTIGAFLASLADERNLGAAFAQLEKIASPAVLSFVENLVTLFMALRQAIVGDIVPAIGNIVSAIGTFASAQSNIEATANGFVAIATAILTVSNVTATLINNLAGIINAATQSEEAMNRVRLAMLALTVVPLAGLIATVALLTAAFANVLIPLALITAAIVGIATAVAGLTGAFSTTVSEIEGIVAGADIDLVPDADTITSELDNIEAEFSNTTTEIERIVDEADIEVLPDVAVTEEATTQIVDVFIDAAETIGETISALVDVTNTELDRIDTEKPASKFEGLADAINVVTGVIEAVINQRIQAIERFFHLVAATATISFAVVAASLNVFLTSLSTVENIVREVFGNIIDIFGITAEASADAWNTIVSIVRSAIVGVGNLISQLGTFFSTLISAMQSTVASWAAQWQQMTGIVGAAASAIGSHIGSIISSLQALSSIQLPTVDLSGLGDVAAGAAEQIDNSVNSARNNLAGFRASLASIRTDFAAGLPGVQTAARQIGAVGGAAQSTTPGLNDLAGGGGGGGRKGLGGVGKAAEEAIPAIEGFNDALAKALRLQEFVNAFGDAGAKAIDSLVSAVVSNIDKDGAKAAEALADFIKELRGSLLPEAEELAAALTSSFAQALIERSDEAIEAAKQVLADAVEAMKAQGRLTLETFRSAFNLADVSRQLGSDGSRLIESLVEAMEKGSTKLNKAIGSATSGIIAGFADKLPIETARDFGNQIVQAIERAIIERTPQAVQALQDLIRSLNFQAEIKRITDARNKAIEEAAKTARETIDRITQETLKELTDTSVERAIRKGVERQIESLKELNDARLEALRQQQAWNRSVRELEREERDIRRNRAREDVETEQNRLEAIDDARKKAAERAREALKGKGTPVGGLTITRGGDSEDELRKELAAIETRFAREAAKRREKRQQEDADRKQRLSDQNQDLIQSFVDANALTNLRNTLNAAVQRIQNQEEERQHQLRLAEIAARANEQIAKAEEVKNNAIEKANEVFTEQETKLNFLTTLADEMFDGALQDVKDINTELDKIAGRFNDLKPGGANAPIEQNEATPEFQRGGVVPGSGPKVVLAHGGEVVLSLAQVKALESRFQPPVQLGASSNTTNFNVSANYGRIQDPGSILLDLQALAAMAAR